MRNRANLDIADAVMLGVVVVWGVNNVFVKAVLGELSPLAFVFGRFLIVVLLLLLWLAVRRRLGVPARADWPLFFLTGVTGFALYNVLFTVGLDKTSAFSVALLISLGPVFTMVFAMILGIERTRPGQWVGAAIASFGVVIFVADKITSGLPTGGDWLSLAAAACFAIYSLSTRRLAGTYGSAETTFWAALIGLVVVAPVTLPAVLAQDWIGLSAPGWAALLYASALSMLLAYSLWGWAIARGGVGRTVPHMFLVPIVSGLAAALWLDEQFGLIKLLGAGLVLAGTAAVRLASVPAGRAVSRAGQTGYSDVHQTTAMTRGEGHGTGNPAHRDRVDQSR